MWCGNGIESECYVSCNYTSKKASSRSDKSQTYYLCLWPSRHNHCRQIPCGQSVTGLHYCAFLQKLTRKMHKTWSHLMEMAIHSSWQWPTQVAHVVIRQLYPYVIYLPVLIWVSQILTFSKRWRNVCEVIAFHLSAAVTRLIRQIEKDCVLDELKRFQTIGSSPLQRRWLHWRIAEVFPTKTICT